ncbi:DUF2971 domain-containing protein [Sinorhizobium meliloti]|uniref:DUF2971 domain-containing protein n=1 Tax=Rhizobium meliloti TaxID=382 RepID=UPI000FDA60C1|nr:DUF2971 domain-containing protein [Sinorhizobium meliloti]RVH50686.1 DUF2971 domain-containing protein [Sinorhizobium meliloti]
MPNTAGMLIYSPISCPAVTDEQIRQIEGDEPEFITRHISSDKLPAARQGFYRFGTTAGYAPKDAQLNPGRLSDIQEGRQLQAFRSRNGHFKRFAIGEGVLTNVSLVGFEHDVVVHFKANDYCSCSSIGEFDPTRAGQLKARGNPDIGGFVTYNLRRLRLAIREIAKETENLTQMKVIGRQVTYGHKDLKWEVEDSFDHDEQRDSLAIWLGISFVKSHAYQHEEEYRLILSDPAKLGRLSEDTGVWQVTDARIAAAIVASGVF